MHESGIGTSEKCRENWRTNHKPRKIGMKINRDAIGKDASPVEWYIHKLAYFAVRAVGADQILAGERTLLTALK